MMKRKMGFVVVSEVGRKLDYIGRSEDGKCAIIRPNENQEIKMGQIWFGILEPLKTFYFFTPLVRYF